MGIESRGNSRTRATLPFDRKTRDIVCRREPTGETDTGGKPLTRIRCNIDQTVISHSPAGFEWAYGGSGPSDFALNILCLFVKPHEHTKECYEFGGVKDVHPIWCEDEDVPCWWGDCPAKAWELHHDFCLDFIATLPKEGGTIHGAEIVAWLRARGVENLTESE